jgi:hypothetical protein
MSTPRKTYRVYSFDAVQKLVTADLIQASADEEAIAHAEAAGFGTKCEVWDCDRLVAQIEGKRRSA